MGQSQMIGGARNTSDSPPIADLRSWYRSFEAAVSISCAERAIGCAVLNPDHHLFPPRWLVRSESASVSLQHLLPSPDIAVVIAPTRAATLQFSNRNPYE